MHQLIYIFLILNILHIIVDIEPCFGEALRTDAPKQNQKKSNEQKTSGDLAIIDFKFRSEQLI